MLWQFAEANGFEHMAFQTPNNEIATQYRFVMNIAQVYEDELREYLPIRFEGLTFHPLPVKRLALYQGAKAAMELMLSSLPVRFVKMSWIEALDALDKEAADEQMQTGYLGSILALLNETLKLNAFQNPKALMLARNAEGKLSSIIVQKEQGSPTVLGSNQMKTVREILAAQNGYEIPDENWNVELVRAQQYLREQRSQGVGGSLEDAVCALAAATGFRAKEIWNWPIREYLGAQNAVDRRLRFQIYTAAEMSGQVKFKNGNPYPTWIATPKGLPAGFKTIKELDDGAKGLLAIPQDKT